MFPALRTALASLGIAVVAIRAVKAQAPAPLTADSLRSIITEVSTIARRNDSVTRVSDDAQYRARLLVEAFKAHNSEWCEYPQGQPELCSMYQTEGRLLNDRSLAMQKELRGIDSVRRTMQARYSSLLNRLRAGPYEPAVAAQKEPLIACSNLPGATEVAACLTRSRVRGRGASS